MSKRKRTIPSGRCVFCGCTGITKEHIFSDWLKKVVSATDTHTQTTTFAEFDHSTKTAFVHPPGSMIRQGSPIQRKVRNVCAGCNNGWMSALVSNAKPYAEQMARGIRVLVPEGAQTAMAAWIGLAIIMAEYTDVRTAVIRQDDRVHMRQTHRPPTSWVICLGRYGGERVRYRHHGIAFFRGPSGEFARRGDVGEQSAQVTTYTLGALMVHAFSATEQQLVDDFVSTWVPPTMVRIWPLQAGPVIWPPRSLLADKDFEDIANRFYHKMLGV